MPMTVRELALGVANGIDAIIQGFTPDEKAEFLDVLETQVTIRADVVAR